MNSLITTRPASLAPISDPNASAALAAAKNLLVRDYPAQPEYLLEPLSARHRAALEHRKRQLDAWLSPAPASEHPRLSKAIAEMLGAFTANSSGNVQATVAKYLHVVSDLPSWAVLKACSSIERGEAEGVSLDYRPSAPRLRDVIRTVMAPWLDELFHLRKVLAAEANEPQDEAMRQRVGQLLRGLAAELRGSKSAQPAQPAETAE